MYIFRKINEITLRNQDQLGLTNGPKNSLILFGRKQLRLTEEVTSSHTIKQHASYQLKGQLLATTMSIKSMVTLDWICSETWPCSLPNMHLAEPLTPHTVRRSTNRKLRHCEFTWVHLNQKIALGHSNAPGGLGGGRIKVYCQVRQKLYLQRG